MANMIIEPTELGSPLRSVPEIDPCATFAISSPYPSFWLADVFCQFGHELFGRKVVREGDFRELLRVHGKPNLMMMGNFILDRAGIVTLCREHGVNVIHVEDGFFPHGGSGSAHGDPLGFCWESSLSRMVFRECNRSQRERGHRCRDAWLSFSPQPLPPGIRKPFVFWPLQLIGDAVNKWDLNVKEWGGLLRHFRLCLPTTFQLVIKPHPRSKSHDNIGVAELVQDLPNTVIVPTNTDLKTLLLECSGVAGANSTVLYEARLMFHKPAYAYARSWFTNHFELFMPVHGRHPPRGLNRFDFVEDNRLMRTERLDEYTDWFLAQLLGRQIDLMKGRANPQWLKEKVYQLSYESWVKYGEEIFERFD